jgi:Diacylglycerol kinase catalytic domain
MSTQSTPYKRCLVISNTKSTNYVRSAGFIEELRSTFDAKDFVEYELQKNDYDNPDKLAKSITKHLDAHTLLCIAGGDGTNSFVINTLLTSKQSAAKAKRAAVLPLWGGNANDLAYMANGLARTKNILDIVQKGSAVPVYPLRLQLTGTKPTNEPLAVCYASFGASAYASYLMNRPGHRARKLYIIPGARLVVEAINVFKAIAGAKRFDCEIDGKTEVLHDLLFINGSRIAKINRAPATITDKSFYEIRVRRKRPVLLSYVISLLIGAAPKRTPVTERSFTVKHATWMQRDGEVSHVDEHTLVSITRHDQPFYLLSTKL